MFLPANITISPKHNFHNACKNFHHVKSAHGHRTTPCWMICWPRVIKVWISNAFLLTLRFHIIIHAIYSLENMQVNLSSLIRFFFNFCWFEIESLDDSLQHTRGYVSRKPFDMTFFHTVYVAHRDLFVVPKQWDRNRNFITYLKTGWLLCTKY